MLSQSRYNAKENLKYFMVNSSLVRLSNQLLHRTIVRCFLLHERRKIEVQGRDKELRSKVAEAESSETEICCAKPIFRNLKRKVRKAV